MYIKKKDWPKRFQSETKCFSKLKQFEETDASLIKTHFEKVIQFEFLFTLFIIFPFVEAQK